MPKLVPALVIALIALIALGPMAGFAATTPAVTPPAVSADDAGWGLSVGLGAVSGMTAAGLLAVTVIGRATMAGFGVGALALIGSLFGGMASNWICSYLYP
jgi:hypothetical protein